MKATPSILVFAALLICGTSQTSSADVLLDNTINQTATLSLPSSSSSLATVNRVYSFTVGSTAINLESVTFGLYGNASGTANVGARLYSGLGSVSLLEDTGTSLFTLSPIATASYYTFTTNWVLNANTTYTVMA